MQIKHKVEKFLSNKFLEMFLMSLIIVNILCLCFETDKTIYTQYFNFFKQIEIYSRAGFEVIQKENLPVQYDYPYSDSDFFRLYLKNS